MMFKSSLIFLSLSAALELVWASSVTITTPEPNDVWEAGSTVHIKWKVNEHSGPIRLQYASGPSNSLSINGLIADNVTATLGKYSWKIPKDIKPKKYVIEAGPSAVDLSFAGYISIKNNRKTKSHKPKTTTKKTKKTSTKKTKKTTKKTSKKTSVKKTTKLSTKKTKKTHSTKPNTKKTKKTQTKKAHTSATTTKHGKRPSAICVGYPDRHRGAATSEDEVRCHSLPKSQSNKSKKTKKTHTKKPKKITTKKAKKTTTTTTTCTASAQ